MKRSLRFQIALTITAFIIIVETFLLIGSIRAQKSELMHLRTTLEDDVKAQSGMDYHKMHPTILSDEDIAYRLSRFSRNVIFLVGVVIIVVVGGTVVIFDRSVVAHIRRLQDLNEKTSHGSVQYYPDNLIPANELGDVIRYRNMMLQSLRGYQENLEKKLDEAKQQIIHQAKIATMGELTAGITHDLNNPLTIIQGHVQKMIVTLEIVPPPVDSIRQSVEKINFAAERIQKLVSRMNKFNRFEFKLSEGVLVSEVLSNAQSLVESKVTTSGVKIQLEVPSDAPKIWCDASSLEQVFVNLISNAIDAMKNSTNKEIKISVGSFGEHILISVSDTGPGIKRENLEDIFRPFFTTKAAGEGTGLGLSICKQIIDKHHGEISVESDLGVGTVFTIKLRTRPLA